MQVNVHCIVLRNVRYSDTQTIVTVYSRELGRFSFLSPAGNTREAARRRALLMPFSEVEGIVISKTGRELLVMKDMSRVGKTDFTANPMKSIVALFLSDLLYALLKEQQPDTALYGYLHRSSEILGELHTAASLANFHISFLLGLIRFFGIEPDCGSYGKGKILDMAGGLWRFTSPLSGKFLNPEESHTAYVLTSKMNMHTMHFFRFTKEQRNRTIDVLLDYLSLHISNLTGIKSLDVVRSLF